MPKVRFLQDFMELLKKIKQNGFGTRGSSQKYYSVVGYHMVAFAYLTYIILGANGTMFHGTMFHILVRSTSAYFKAPKPLQINKFIVKKFPSKNAGFSFSWNNGTI